MTKPMPGEFLDTNVLIYAFTDHSRSHKAQELLARGCTIGVQVLNEFTNVARRKLKMNWGEVGDALSSIRILCPTVVPMDLDILDEALVIAERHGLQIFDALMVASAKHCGCDVLWSEDMQDGMIIDDRLQIIDPFRLP